MRSIFIFTCVFINHLFSHGLSPISRIFRHSRIALSAKKIGRREESEGIKLGKGFGAPSQSLPAETPSADIQNPLAYSRVDNPDPNINSSYDDPQQASRPVSPGGLSAASASSDADAVFEKYGIGKGKTDRFGNEETAVAPKRQLKPGETRPFGEG